MWSAVGIIFAIGGTALVSMKPCAVAAKTYKVSEQGVRIGPHKPSQEPPATAGGTDNRCRLTANEIILIQTVPKSP